MRWLARKLWAITLHAIVCLTLIIACRGVETKERKIIEMNERENLVILARNPSASLGDRIRAVENIGAFDDSAAVANLRSLLARPITAAGLEVKGWDPLAAERVVNLHIVAALYRLGDTRGLGRISELISQAGRTLTGHNDEAWNAAAVILSIGHIEPIEQIVSLCKNRDKIILTNAVRTLNLLKLPQTPVGGPVDDIPQLSETVTFEICRFQEELETIEKLSRSSIILSKGTKKFIQANDYERGTVKREGVKLANLVQEDLDMLDLCYYADAGKVVVCTYEEAGQRWRRWWASYGKNLAYNKKASCFVLRR